MRWFDKYIMMNLWLMLIPLLISGCLILAGYDVFVLNSDHNIEVYLNIAGVASCILVLGWTINITWSFIISIVDKIHDFKLKKYYEEHPEKEKEMNEKIVRDFEELIECMKEKIEDKNKE